MENLNFTAEIVHKQRAHELQEEARIERFLNDKKTREENEWLLRRMRRNRKNK